MQLGLNKLPWYGQVMLFAAVIGGAGIVSYHYFYAGFPGSASSRSAGDDAAREPAEKETQLAQRAAGHRPRPRRREAPRRVQARS